MWAGLFVIALYRVNVRVVVRLLALELRGYGRTVMHRASCHSLISKRFLHLEGGAV